jgi:hypothetical protein
MLYNLDEQAYRLLRSRAVLEGKTVAELMNEAIRAYLTRQPSEARRPVCTIGTRAISEGNEHLSGEIDAILYR